MAKYVSVDLEDLKDIFSPEALEEYFGDLDEEEDETERALSLRYRLLKAFKDPKVGAAIEEAFSEYVGRGKEDLDEYKNSIEKFETLLYPEDIGELVTPEEEPVEEEAVVEEPAPEESEPTAPREEAPYQEPDSGEYKAVVIGNGYVSIEDLRVTGVPWDRIEELRKRAKAKDWDHKMYLQLTAEDVEFLYRGKKLRKKIPVFVKQGGKVYRFKKSGKRVPKKAGKKPKPAEKPAPVPSEEETVETMPDKEEGVEVQSQVEFEPGYLSFKSTAGKLAKEACVTEDLVSEREEELAVARLLEYREGSPVFKEEYWGTVVRALKTDMVPIRTVAKLCGKAVQPVDVMRIVGEKGIATKNLEVGKGTSMQHIFLDDIPRVLKEMGIS